jgi:hypothetical protein
MTKRFVVDQEIASGYVSRHGAFVSARRKLSDDLAEFRDDNRRLLANPATANPENLAQVRRKLAEFDRSLAALEAANPDAMILGGRVRDHLDVIEGRRLLPAYTPFSAGGA